MSAMAACGRQRCATHRQPGRAQTVRSLSAHLTARCLMLLSGLQRGSIAASNNKTKQKISERGN